MWQAPIFDRTPEDVAYANANRDSPIPLKGARNYTDINRIVGNMQYARDFLVSAGYALPEITSRGDWTMTDFPRESDIRKIMTDLTVLRSTDIISPDTPSVPALPYTHYQKINDIEKILFDIERLYRLMLKTYIKSGSRFSHSKSTLYINETQVIPYPDPPVITTDTLPYGIVGVDYSTTIEASSNSPIALIWSIVSGALPDGLSIASSAVTEALISGIPSKIGIYDFDVRATNAVNASSVKNISIFVTKYETPLRSGSQFAYSGSGLYFKEDSDQ